MQAATPTATRRALRALPTADKIGRSRSGMYELMNPQSPYYDPTFPKPIRLGHRAVGWLEHEVDLWLMAKAAARRT